jgi:AraC-like DNA-binding protein
MELNLRKDDVEKLHHARKILVTEFKSHYTNEQLAQKVGTNEYKLKHGFKQLFHVSPYRFLTQVRIEKAKDILERTEQPLKGIAITIGVFDVPNFIRSFKRVTGVSPNEWRRRSKLRIAG